MTEQRLRFANIAEPTDDMIFHEPKVWCKQCQDVGTVLIFKPETIEQAIKDPDNVNWRRTCAVLCTCANGERNAQTYNANSNAEINGERIAGKPVPTFGDCDWHILANSPTAKADACMYQPAPPSNYHKELGEYVG